MHFKKVAALHFTDLLHYRLTQNSRFPRKLDKKSCVSVIPCFAQYCGTFRYYNEDLEEEDFDGGIVKATADFEGSAGAFAAASTTIVHF